MIAAHSLLVAPFETLGFMRSALVACLALSLANGTVGTLLLLRRMSLDGDVLGHAVMPGAAVGYLYAGPSPNWLTLGGLASGLAVAALAGAVTRRGARDDTGLVAFYLVALSVGVLLVAWRGSNVDLVRVLFGTVLAIDRQALWQIAPATRGILPPGAGGELPGFRHATRGRADALASGRGAVLEPWRRGLDRTRHRLWPRLLGLRTADFVSWQSAVWAGNRAIGRDPVRPLASGRRRLAPSFTAVGEPFMTLRSASRRRLLVVATLAPLLAAPAWAADRIAVVATFSVIGDMIAQVGGNHLD